MTKAAMIAFFCVSIVLFAACGGENDSTEPPAPAVTTVASSTSIPAATATAPIVAAPAEGAPTIAVGTAGLVDARGFSLYIFANDVVGSGSSACGPGCQSAWPPLVVDGLPTGGDGILGEVGTITRTDGRQQVTYNGSPLYFFVNDAAVGETNGKDIPNWSLAQP